MDREAIKQLLVEYGWDAAERERVAAALSAAREDPECRAAVEDYDRIRAALRDTGASAGAPRLAPHTPPAAPDDSWEPAWLHAPAQLSSPQPAQPPTGARVPWPWLATAAALLLAASAWRSGLPGGRHTADLPSAARAPVAAASVSAADLALTPDDVQRYAGVFREVAGVFGSDARWVLLGDDGADVGVRPAPPAAPDASDAANPANLLLLRLVLRSGDIPLTRSNLVMVPGEHAELTVPLPTGDSIFYEIATTTGAAARVSLWAELRSAGGGGRALASLATDLPIDPGAVRTAGEMATTSGEYELTVAFARGPAPEVHP